MEQNSGRSAWSNWRAALKRFLVAFAFCIVATGIVLGAVAKLSSALLLGAVITFFRWPLIYQALAIVAALIVIGAIARGVQFYQDYRSRVQQHDTAVGTGDALNLTVIPRMDTSNVLLGSLVLILNEMRIALFRLAPQGIEPAATQTVINVEAIATEARVEESSDHVPTVHPGLSEIFIGRESELEWLEGRLAFHGYDQDTTVVFGIAGIGKSALVTKAIEVVQRTRFTDSVIFVDCRGKDDPVAVIRSTLECIDSNRHLPPALSPDVLQQASEQLLSDRERLIVLDGVELNNMLGEVVRALRTKQHTAHILITTTAAPLTDVAPVESQLHLRPLGIERSQDGDEVDLALELFAKHAGKQSAKEFGDELPYAVSIVTSLQRHTYALQLMGAYVRWNQDILRGVADDVRKLKTGEVTRGVEGVLAPVLFALTITLDKLRPEARRLLYGFVFAFGNVEAGRRATRALGDAQGLKDKDGVIYELLSHQLMESFERRDMPPRSDRHRLRIHPLLLGHASQLQEKPEFADDVVLARNAAATFYAHYLGNFEYPDPSRSTHKALEVDAHVITRSLTWAASQNQHEHVSPIAHGMRRYWHDRWLNDQSERFLTTAKESATALADRARRENNRADEQKQRQYAADMSFTLGRVFRRTGRLGKAKPLFELDLAYRRSQGQHAAEAEALHQLAQLERSRGRMQEGLRYCRMGLAVVQRYLPRDGQYDTKEAKDLLQAKGLLIAQQGRIERSRGNLALADQLFEQAFTLFTETGDLLEQGVALGYRGRIARVRGQLDLARDYFERSRILALQVNDLRGLGVIATQFGRIARMQGDVAGSEQAFNEGLSLAEQVGDRTAEAVNHNYLGRIAAARGNTFEAEGRFNRARDIAIEIEDRLEEGVNLHYLGRIARKRGLPKQARRRLNSSLRILRKVEDRRGQALVLAQLALIDIDQHHLWRARWRLSRSLRLIEKVGDRRSEGTIGLYYGQLELASRNSRAARVWFTESLKRAHYLGDAGGEAEAQEWLDKLPAKRKTIGAERP